MWSHYADSHRGLVIGFDYENSFFHKTENSLISIPYLVDYSGKRPTFYNYSKINARDMLPQEEIRKFFLTKSVSWTYEEEIRMFAQPETAKMVTKDKNGFDCYLFDFPKESLKKIIFGSLMKKEDKKEISEIAKRLYPRAELFQAIPSETEFALKFKAYKI